MPHIFSVEIHVYLSTKIQETEGKKKQAIADKDESLQRHVEGELLELMTMRQYLNDNIDLKTQKYF